jgi:hypothetical protein
MIGRRQGQERGGRKSEAARAVDDTIDIMGYAAARIATSRSTGGMRSRRRRVRSMIGRGSSYGDGARSLASSSYSLEVVASLASQKLRCVRRTAPERLVAALVSDTRSKKRATPATS